MSYQSNHLFADNLEARSGDKDEKARERLRSRYDIMWRRGVEVAAQISRDFNGLTLHDERHLLAVWDRAAQLTGEKYDLNPLECFILGCVIIIHDTGHALTTYKGGSTGLRDSVQFKDNLTKILFDKSNGKHEKPNLTSATNDDIKAAIFATARQLHADQAARIVQHPIAGTDKYLLDDEDIRTDLGELIGLIAASHNWSLTDVGRRLPSIQGAPGYLPQDWQIRPLKIACLLRCADAIQIDQRRTPRFEFSILNPSGYSRLHWLAQQLAQPVVEPGHPPPGQLIFTSLRPFPIEDADAWWIASDLIDVANKELGECYQFMKNKSLPIFTVDRVAGAGGAQQLSSYIRTNNWSPVKAEVRIADVDHIVRLFGGFGLYGHDLSVPLRELIQNSADAIRARRVHENDDTFGGRITVKASAVSAEGLRKITIEDNGIGMSEAVLTGPLLEFGKSFWVSDEIKREFPGLLSSKLRQTGRFGIGFFASFMASNNIIVTSVDCRASRTEAKSLIFRDAIKLRPLLSPAVEPLRASVNTKVELLIEEAKLNRILTINDRFGRRQHIINLEEFISHLCPTLDCDVYTQFEDGELRMAHQAKWCEQDGSAWLESVSLAKYRTSDKERSYITSRAGSLDVINDSDGIPCGRATIATVSGNFGVYNIGGLIAGSQSGSFDSMAESYLGSIAREPDGPRRNAGALSPSHEVIAAWASSQATKLAAQSLPQVNQYVAAINVSEFGGDPTPVGSVLLNKEVLGVSKLIELLETGVSVYAPVDDRGSDSDDFYIDNLLLRLSPGHRTYLNREEVEASCNYIEPLNIGHSRQRNYHHISANGSLSFGSLFECVERILKSRGQTLKITYIEEHHFGTYVGEGSAREGITKGQELKEAAIKFEIATS